MQNEEKMVISSPSIHQKRNDIPQGDLKKLFY